MGKDCSIWFNAVLRGDVNTITIGNRVNIQDNSVIHYTYTTTTGQAGSKTALFADTQAKYGPLGLQSNATVYAYMQFKVRCNDTPGVGELNNFRSSEMLLIEAEAEHMMGNTSAAQAALVALNKTSGRDPEYSCNKTGTDLPCMVTRLTRPWLDTST